MEEPAIVQEHSTWRSDELRLVLMKSCRCRKIKVGGCQGSACDLNEQARIRYFDRPCLPFVMTQSKVEMDLFQALQALRLEGLRHIGLSA